MIESLNVGESNKDVFDILGISSKEDVFTNLLAEAFNVKSHQIFRDKFCNALSNDKFSILNTDDCEIYTRCVFNIEKSDDTGNRSKVLPDMLMVSPSQKSVVIIENKVFSGEGYRQTVAYSSSVFMSELEKMLKSKYNISNDFNVEFYFMTLLGEKASSDLFKPLKWTDVIVDTYDDSQLILPYNILLADLNSRAEELKTFIEEPGNSNKSFSDYYKHQNRWIDSKIVVSKYLYPMLENIVCKYGGKVDYAISKAKGRSLQILVQLYTEDWEQNNLDEYEKGEQIERFEHTRNIHLEFSWGAGKNDASLLMHYETNPYYSDDDLKKEFPEIEPGYKKHRQAFKESIREAIEGSNNWKESNTKIALAKTTCKDFMNISYGGFQSWFTEAFDEAYNMINNILNMEK